MANHSDAETQMEAMKKLLILLSSGSPIKMGEDIVIAGKT